MKRLRSHSWVVCAGFALILSVFHAGSAAAQNVTFKEDILPILELRCVECHQPGGSGYEASGLDLRTYEGVMKGTKHGAMVIPNNPLESNLLRVVEHRTSKEIRMPHNRKRLSSCEIRALRFWISQGAKDN
jgi:hypothetical protein